MSVRWKRFATDVAMYRKVWEIAGDNAGPVVTSVLDQGTARLRDSLVAAGLDPADETVLAALLLGLQLVRSNIRNSLRGNDAFHNCLDGLLLAPAGGLVVELLPDGVAV